MAPGRAGWLAETVEPAYCCTAMPARDPGLQGVKNGCGGNSTGTSAVPQIADDIGAPRKSSEVGQKRSFAQSRRVLPGRSRRYRNLLARCGGLCTTATSRDAGIMTGHPRIAADLLHRPSRQSWTKAHKLSSPTERKAQSRGRAFLYPALHAPHRKQLTGVNTGAIEGAVTARGHSFASVPRPAASAAPQRLPEDALDAVYRL